MRGEAGSLLQRARSAIVHGQSLYFSFRPCSPPCPSPVVTMATGAVCAAAATTVAEQKRALRSRIRKELKALSFAQRCQEDLEIQKNILDSSWFKPSKSLCAYVSCESLREVDTSQILAEVLKDKDPSKEKAFCPSD
ncbi:5-formyltetrahydrofolate cyclo-ligase [Apostasia shenzhenica]|uniref:5-formyltetrahydrofolate cyclo-ligase n=1 Tax=Apostasia shenzhenica TaxID=1088818 RepID=A0A2I0B7R0_9ASPA|nr:5-formyltetrahydrofolate cyclo-ligase [Apostasia shenzhenica]